MATTDTIASLSNADRYLLKSLTRAGTLEKAQWGRLPQDPNYSPEILAASQQRLRRLGLVEDGATSPGMVQATPQGRAALAGYEQRDGPIIMSITISATTTPPVDILVTNAELQPIVVVEVKNREHLSRDIAVRLFRDLVAQVALPGAPYFLLVSQDRGFLWKDPRPGSLDPPALEFPMGEVVDRYAPAPSPSRRLREQELQNAVAHWLLDLTDVREDIRTGPESMLRDAGLIGAIQGAIVITDPHI